MKGICLAPLSQTTLKLLFVGRGIGVQKWEIADSGPIVRDQGSPVLQLMRGMEDERVGEAGYFNSARKPACSK